MVSFSSASILATSPSKTNASIDELVDEIVAFVRFTETSNTGVVELLPRSAPRFSQTRDSTPTYRAVASPQGTYALCNV
ncbi:hypothetical protein KRP22_000161 [Phytophthora ramorum]|uniref:uncharacterized protein n=1 Tax=Phytophthora ramorum TaxID=164328 RepID=UPI00309EDC77|nr:hypothetical protein KRP23_7010 [Phytophthora ramorum]KAH7497987.1 hypothetical protein KRP22_12107 [Phytophthora ramorum]